MTFLLLASWVLAPLGTIWLLSYFRDKPSYLVVRGAVLTLLSCWVAASYVSFLLNARAAAAGPWHVGGVPDAGTMFALSSLLWVAWSAPGYFAFIAALTVRRGNFRVGLVEVAFVVGSVASLVATAYFCGPHRPRPTPLQSQWGAVGASPIQTYGKLTGLDFSTAKPKFRAQPAALEMLRGQSDLTMLSLAGRRINEPDLACFAFVPNLRTLDLTSTQISDDGFKHLTCLQDLMGLTLNRSQIGDRGIAWICQLKALESLSLHNTRITDESFRELRTLPHLDTLFAENTQVTSKGLQYLRGMKSLKYLDLAGTHVDDDGLQAISDIPNLQRITLHRTNVTSRAIVGALDELNVQGRKLSIEGPIIAGRLEKWNSVGAEFCFGRGAGNSLRFTQNPVRLAGLRGESLAELDLGGREIDPQQLDNLAFVPYLRSLNLAGSNLTNEGLARLNHVPHLQVLELSDTAITDDGTGVLLRLHALTNLSLANTRIGDATLAYLVDCKKLDLLDVSGTRITGKGLQALQGLPWLRTLDLTGSPVDDDGFRAAVGISGLTLLRVGNSKITRQTVDQARADINATGRELAVEFWDGATIQP